jgi:hypothetical protein
MTAEIADAVAVLGGVAGESQFIHVRVLAPRVGSDRERPHMALVGAASFQPDEIEDAARWAINLREEGDVYFGPAARDRDLGSTCGGPDDVTGTNRVWVDLDTDEGLDAFEAASLPTPTFTVDTGSRTESGRAHLHVHWDLTEGIGEDEARDLLVRLAQRVHGDTRAASPAQILRVPGTLNHSPHGVDGPAPVVLLGGGTDA